MLPDLALFAVLQTWPSASLLFPSIRDTVLAGPALAGTVGLIAWLVAGSFSSASRAANDNAPPLAPVATRR